MKLGKPITAHCECAILCRCLCGVAGDAENAGLEKSGLENVEPNRRGGKDGTGKHGTKFPGMEKAGLENARTSRAWVAKCNIINVRGHVRVNVTAGRGDPRTLQEATQSGN